MDAYSPIKGKCIYWREAVDPADMYDASLKPEDRHVECTCFIEGTRWLCTAGSVPSDCPERRRCRYYVFFG